MGDFFKNIGDIIKRFFNWIGDLFTRWFTPKSSVPASTTPVNSDPQQNISAPEPKLEKLPLVGPETPKEVAATLRINEHLDANCYVLENMRTRFNNSARGSVDATYGTPANPVLDQANDGRLIVNIPAGSEVGLTQAYDDPSMAVLLVMPGGQLSDNVTLKPPAFKGQAALIPKKLLKNAQVVFNQVDLAGVPANHGAILIGTQSGLLDKGSALVMQNVIYKVQSRNVDVFVNGHFQKGSKVSGAGLLATTEQSIAEQMAPVREERYQAERDQLVAEQAVAKARHREHADARGQQGFAYHGAHTTTHRPQRDSADVHFGIQTQHGIRLSHLSTGFRPR